MRIRWKISILVAALFAVLAICEIHVAKDVLMPSFTELERQEAEVAMRRIDLALERTFEQLRRGRSVGETGLIPTVSSRTTTRASYRRT